MSLAALWLLTASVTAGCAGGEGLVGPPPTSTGPTAAAAGGAITRPARPAPPPPAPPACSPARAAPAAAAGSPATPQTLVAGGRTRSYLLSLPAGYDGAAGVPLVLNLHGFTSNKEQQSLLTRLPEQGAAAGYVVVTPDAEGSGRAWNMFELVGEPDDFAFLDELVAYVSTTLCIDANRVFATGISNGSAMAALLACRPPHRFAAIGLVSTSIGPTCGGDVAVSVLAFHGVADPVVPYGGGMVNSVAAHGRDAPPVEQAVAEWARHDGCRPTPDEVKVSPTARRLAFPDCEPGLAVELYSLTGAGHTWPGGLDLQKLGITMFGATAHDVAATDLLLTFFREHPRRSG